MIHWLSSIVHNPKFPENYFFWYEQFGVSTQVAWITSGIIVFMLGSVITGLVYNPATDDFGNILGGLAGSAIAGGLTFFAYLLLMLALPVGIVCVIPLVIGLKIGKRRRTLNHIARKLQGGTTAVI